MTGGAGRGGLLAGLLVCLLACAGCGQPGDPPPVDPTTTDPISATPTRTPTSVDVDSPSPRSQDGGGWRPYACPGFVEEEPKRGMPSADMVGTEGPDRIVGTEKPEVICGLGGDDTIDGGGGADVIYGGDGADHLIYTDPDGKARPRPIEVFEFFGGDGDDVLEIKHDTDNDIYPDLLVGGDGDDVLIGPMAGAGVHFEGSAGNDVMLGTPLKSTGTNHMNGGDGHDVAVALNLSTGLNHPDYIDLDGKPELTLGTACTVTVPMDPRPGRRSNGKVSCDIPWPRELSSLDDVVSISTSMDETGKVSFDSSMYQNLASLSVSSWRNVVEVQGTFASDVCLCDPLVPIGQHPKSPYQPMDWSS